MSMVSAPTGSEKMEWKPLALPKRRMKYVQHPWEYPNLSQEQPFHLERPSCHSDHVS